MNELRKPPLPAEGSVLKDSNQEPSHITTRCDHPIKFSDGHSAGRRADWLGLYKPFSEIRASR